MPDKVGDIVNAPEGALSNLDIANSAFRRLLKQFGLTFARKLQKIVAKEDMLGDPSVQEAMALFSSKVGELPVKDVISLSIFDLLNFGLSNTALLQIGDLVIGMDKQKNNLASSSSFPNTLEDTQTDSYEEDFEELSSPDKSLGESSLLSEAENSFAMPPMKLPSNFTTHSNVSEGPIKTLLINRSKDKEWIAKGQWTMGEKIGAGSFGEVFKGLNNKHGKIFAVKRMRITPGRYEELLNLANEIDLMRNMYHPNIVSYIGTKVFIHRYL